MKKKIIIWSIVIAVIGSIVALKIAGNDKKDYVKVKTAQVVQGDIKSYLSTTATIKSKNSKDYFPLQGKVKTIKVKVGDSVVKGQTLIEYEIADPNAAVKQAQIQYDNAVLAKQILVNNNNDIKNKITEIDKKISSIDKQINQLQSSAKGASATAENQSAQLQRTKEILNSVYQSISVGSPSTDMITNLQTQKAQLQQTKETLKPISNEQIKQSDNNIALAKIALENAKLNLSKSQDKLIADFDGMVTAVGAVEGSASMSIQQAAVTVQDVVNLKAMLFVGKYDAEKIKLGQDAVIKSSSKEYKGKVSFIDPAAKKTVSAAGSDTTLGVEVDILESSNNLKIDFDADIDVLLGEVKNVIKVPAESIKTDKEGKSFLYLIEGERSVLKEVKLGIQSDMEAQVVEGVKVSDKVILNPGESVKDGTLVREEGEK